MCGAVSRVLFASARPDLISCNTEELLAKCRELENLAYKLAAQEGERAAYHLPQLLFQLPGNFNHYLLLRAEEEIEKVRMMNVFTETRTS
jgi:hypothetical protein